MLDKFQEDHQLFHSGFQIENFILIKNGKTTYGIYKQCLRELLSRESNLRAVYAQKMRQQIDFEELEDSLNIIDDKSSYQARRFQIDRAEMVYGMRDTEKIISESEREYRHFYNAAVYLKNKIGEISGERREVLEAEMWKEQCKYKACSDIRFLGCVSVETYGLVDSFPNSTKNDLLRFFGRISTPQGEDERKHFLSEYTSNFEFQTDLDKVLPEPIKKLVEESGS